nr:MAG TPA: hypothetical protein [Caudoviricetes sp.]
MISATIIAGIMFELCALTRDCQRQRSMYSHRRV